MLYEVITEIASEPGPDVLVLQGMLFDIVSRVPPQPVGAGEIYVAGDDGLTAFRDASAVAATIPVTVASNFFQPSALAIDTGDTVVWENRITSYNVCYTKLLRTSSSRSIRRTSRRS